MWVWCDHGVNVCGNVIFLYSLLGLQGQGYRTLCPGTDIVHLWGLNWKGWGFRSTTVYAQPWDKLLSYLSWVRLVCRSSLWETFGAEIAWEIEDVVIFDLRFSFSEQNLTSSLLKCLHRFSLCRGLTGRILDSPGLTQATLLPTRCSLSGRQSQCALMSRAGGLSSHLWQPPCPPSPGITQLLFFLVTVGCLMARGRMSREPLGCSGPELSRVSKFT